MPGSRVAEQHTGHAREQTRVHVLSFPNVTGAMRQLGFDDVNAFATAALHATGVSFCTRSHFGRSQPGEMQHYVRFAYSGINASDIRGGVGEVE